jgi:hypothetical protein
VSRDDVYRGQMNPAREMAQQLDFGNGREVTNFLQDIYRTDRYAFRQLAQQINRNERNGMGDDLTITENGQVYVGHPGRQERVGQIDQARHGQGGWSYPNGGMRDRHGPNYGRGRIDVDINIPPLPYPRNGGWGNDVHNNPGREIYRPYPQTRYPDYDRFPSGHRSNGNAEVIGTIVGGVAGGIIGERNDRHNGVTGALLGALGGNVIGRQIDRNNEHRRDYRWQR